MEKKINMVIWAAISAAAAVWAVLHPRISSVIAVIYSLFVLYSIHSKCDKLYTPDDGSEPVKTEPRSTTYSLKRVILLPIVVFLGSWLNVFCPYHATYEYRSEIARLKERYSGVYSHDHFPDEIPEGARHVKWVSSPYLVSCDMLMFYADADYIDSVVGEYPADARIYPITIDPEDEPNEELRRQYERESLPSFTARKYIPAGTIDGVEVLMLNSNGDLNHYSCGGIFYNRTSGYIGYFFN